MAITVVQTVQGGANSLTVTIASTTAGNCLVVCVASSSTAGAGSVSGITLGGSAGNFAEAISDHGTSGSTWADAFIWADPSCAGGQTSVVISGTNLQFTRTTVYEVSGLAAALVVDKTSSGSAATGTSWSSGSTASTTLASEFWAGCADVSAGNATGPSAPWANTGTGGSEIAGQQITSGTGTALYNGTQNASAPWAAVVATFKTPPAGTDLPQISPGPAWLRRFKPGLPRPRPPVPPSGPYFGNQPNPSSVRDISPGLAWLDHFKPGMPRPRPFIPQSGGVPVAGGLAVPVRPGMAGSVTVSPGALGGLPVRHPGMTGTLQVPIVTSGALNRKHPGITGTVAVPVVTSGALNRKHPAIVTPPTLRDLPQIRPGPTWLARFRRGGARKPFKIGGGAQHIGTQGTAGLNRRHPGLAAQIIQYLPFPQFPLSLLFELNINGTWLDVTSFVYGRDQIVINRGLPDETQSVSPSQMTLTLNNRDGRFSPNNPAGAYFPYLTRNVQLRCSVINQASADGTPYSGYRFWGEVSSWPPRWDSSGTDIYCQIVVSGVLRRFVQGAKLGSTLRQYYTSLTGDQAPYAYWPAEDGSSATEIASALQDVAAATFTGNPQFGGDSSFGGADALPVISGSVWHGVTAADADPPGTGTITQRFPGTYTFTAPPGVTAVTGLAITGAGGGGGDQNTTVGGGGGGGGGVGKAASAPVTPGGRYTYINGAGGAAGAGGTGGDGADSSFTSDSGALTGRGGKGGAFGAAGGLGGSGATFAGGTGGAGSTAGSSNQNFTDQFTGSSGATGGATGGTAGQTTQNWTSPITGTISVSGVGGGGGGQGGGTTGTGTGGGGGGGGQANGSVDVTEGSSYAFHAGNGGRGGSNGDKGDHGADSGVNGDSLGCFGHGGAQGAGNGQGGAGGGFNAGSGSGSSGSAGGDGSNVLHSPLWGGGGGGGGSAEDPGTGHNASGRNPGSGGGDGSGGGWGATNSTGSGATLGGTGGSYGGGGGGGGATGNNTGKNGGGGGPGFVQWSWTVSSSSNPGGGGGGSSAGTSGAGNAGSSSGSGGTAPTGGGAGGSAGGTPGGAGPGGGGAGAVPAATDGSADATLPGSGAAGQVTFSWNGGVTSPVAADIIRFALHVDSQGAADGAVLLRALTFGTIAQLDVVYHTGGNLELIGYNTSSAVVFDSGLVAFNADGVPLLMTVELTGSGTGATWLLAGVQPGASSLQASKGGTVASVSIGSVSDVLVNPGGMVTDSGTALGEITAQTYAATLLDLAGVAGGFAGELAADRLARLCAAQGIGFTLAGTGTDTPQMGPQQDDTFVNLLQSCADLDRGQLYETRDSLGIGYRTRVSMQGQDPAFVADYSAGVLASALAPTADDQYTRNDITVTRDGGASSSAVLTTGAMSTQSPPNGVGDYTQSITVQAYSDSQLVNLVTWLLTVGTVDEYRYPTIAFDMARLAVEDLFSLIPALDIGDFIQVSNPPSFLQSDPVSQLCWGFTETLNAYTWTIEISTVPESPYSQGNPPAW